MDDVTVLEALADHVRGKTPPQGRVVKKVFAYPVESISGALPAVVLYSGADSVEYGASNRRTTLTVKLALYLPLVEYAAQYKILNTWRAWVRDLLIDGVTLNSTDGVSQASVTSTDINSTEYAEAPVIEVSCNIEIVGVEAISTSA